MQTRTRISEEIRKGVKYLMFGLIFIVIIISIIFFIKASSSAQKGYQLKQLQTQKNQLEDENRELKLKLLEIKSGQKIEEEAKEQDMEPIENPLYLK